MLSWQFTLAGHLGHAAIEFIGRLNGLYLGFVNSNTDAAGALRGNNGRVGGELRLGLIGQSVGAVQQLQVLVELKDPNH